MEALQTSAETRATVIIHCEYKRQFGTRMGEMSNRGFRRSGSKEAILLEPWKYKVEVIYSDPRGEKRKVLESIPYVTIVE